MKQNYNVGLLVSRWMDVPLLLPPPFLKKSGGISRQSTFVKDTKINSSA